MTMITCSKPARSASTRAWWITGNSPSGSSSLGMARDRGRKRVPRPAAGMTARISGWASCRDQGAEMGSLLRPQPVAEPSLRNIDVLVADDGVLWNVAAQPAALRDAHRQQPLFGDDVGVLALPVGQVAADAVEQLAAVEVRLGGGDHLDQRAAKGGKHRKDG